MGDGLRDALQRGVPARRPRPPDPRRRLRPVVPSLRDERGDRATSSCAPTSRSSGTWRSGTPGVPTCCCWASRTRPRPGHRRAEERFERADYRAGFELTKVGSWIQLLTHEIVPLGAVRATELPGPIHTLRHPILSDSAARAFFAGGQAPLPRMPSEAASQAAASAPCCGRSSLETRPARKSWRSSPVTPVRWRGHPSA